MNDASAGWELEYAFAGLSPAAECQFPGCDVSTDLELLVIGESAYQACRRHAKDILGVTS